MKLLLTFFCQTQFLRVASTGRGLGVFRHWQKLYCLNAQLRIDPVRSELATRRLFGLRRLLLSLHQRRGLIRIVLLLQAKAFATEVEEVERCNSRSNAANAKMHRRRSTSPTHRTPCCSPGRSADFSDNADRSRETAGSTATDRAKCWRSPVSDRYAKATRSESTFHSPAAWRKPVEPQSLIRQPVICPLPTHG